MAHRYFTQEIEGAHARITGDDAAHLARVLRAKPGDKIILCDGRGTDYDARIATVAANEITLVIEGSVSSTVEPTLFADVYLGYAKGQRLEWAIQKCVELGAARIRPFFSEKSLVKPKNEEEKNARYMRIAHEAAKQAGRGILPTVEMPVPYAKALEMAAENDLALFLYEGGGAPVQSVLRGQASVAIITGPEAGFTPVEAQEALLAGCQPITLGPRILRCETAPMAALAVVMALSGNLQ